METSEQKTSSEPAAVIAMDERRLLPRHRRGDPAAFGELLALYQAPVFGYLIRCGVPEGDRDDLFQDIFLKIHGAAATYQADRPLKPWLFTVVANTVRGYFRKQKVEQWVYPQNLQDPQPNSQDLLEAGETSHWLKKAIGALPLAQREVVVLACLEKLNLNKVAEILDLPLGTVKTHLHRARLALTRALARHKTLSEREVCS